MEPSEEAVYHRDRLERKAIYQLSGSAPHEESHKAHLEAGGAEEGSESW